MLSFSFSAAKMKKGDMSIAKGHNLRLHQTESQLPKEAWLADKARYKVIAWDDERAELGRSLAKRKDAVIGIEMTFQVGSQTDWREKPTKANIYGQPKAYPANLKAMGEQIGTFLAAEFGEDNIVSLDLHMDESSPHFHAVVTPIKDGKLNAKHWMDGPARLSKLYERAHRAVAEAVPCEYQKGSGLGGKPHDRSQRAGAVEPPGMLDKLMRISQLTAENAQLRARVQELEQVAFSQAKRKVTLAAAEAMLDEARKTKAEADAIKAEAIAMQEQARRDAEMARGTFRPTIDTIAGLAPQKPASGPENAKKGPKSPGLG